VIINNDAKERGITMDSLLDILIIFSGLYIIYSSVQMMVLKQIPSLLIGKNTKIPQGADTDGYRKAMFWPTFVIGIIGLIGGGISYLSNTQASLKIPALVVVVFYLICSILFSIYAKKTQDKYLMLH